jgi:hypothetical protein
MKNLVVELGWFDDLRNELSSYYMRNGEQGMDPVLPGFKDDKTSILFCHSETSLWISDLTTWSIKFLIYKLE